MSTQSPPRTSLIVVSRGRPQMLARCLLGVGQLDHPDFELIIVADDAGLAATRNVPAKRIAFDAANISEARNAGLAVAAGEVVAFLDDDSVPEATWLSRLVAPFSNPDVAAAGGFVRARNGIDFQWRASVCDRYGEISALPVDPKAVSLHPPMAGRAVRTEGTNCAFRRQTLCKIGGFDPAFRYFLDETDVNMRLAQAGHLCAVVPLAQVHHGLAASSRRSSARTPLTLHDIGASSAVFWRKYAAAHAHEAGLRLRTRQRLALVRQMVAGNLEPRDVQRLLQTLDDGLCEGATRPLAPLPALPESNAAFERFPSYARPSRIFAGRPWQIRRLRREAETAVKNGARATVFVFSPTLFSHRHVFSNSGVWEHHGGIWGRSERAEGLFETLSFRARLKRERDRLTPVRAL
jgi:GT2 family glycosyltransferase